MSDLSSLLTGQTREELILDLSQLVENTIDAQSGLTGMTLKATVGAAKKIDSDIINNGLGRMLPEILGDLQEHWNDYQNQPAAERAGDFGQFLSQRENRVVDAFLAIADRQAETINVPALAKAYNSLRGRSAKIIAPAIGDFGRIVEKHMP